MCLGLSMSGVSFCGMDIGGFMGAPTPELFTRWIQLGTFTPLFRAHTCIDTPDQEPWSFGDRHEEINKKFIQLRYQLLPYIYDAFYESSMRNTAIMHPMIYEFQDDPQMIYMDDQFMFGEDFLIAPVYQENQSARKVYFPAGEWYDYWTGEKTSGPEEKWVDAPLDKTPIFVKAGAIVPMQEVMNYVGEKIVDPLILHIYPQQGIIRDSLYEDDGISFDYEKGIFSITPFDLTVDQQKISFITDQRIGKFFSADRSYLIQIHEITTLPQKIELNGEKLIEFKSLDQLGQKEQGWNFESETRTLTVKYPDYRKRMKLEVIF